MNYKPLSEKNRYRRFECRKHSLLQIPECCTYMNADLLEETILLMLNKELMQRGNALKQKNNLESFQQAGIRALKRDIEKIGQEIKQIQTCKEMLYEKYAFREMSVEDYTNEIESMSDQLLSLSQKLNEKQRMLSGLEEESLRIEEDMKQIIKYSHVEVLTQEVVDTFIKKVYVYKGKRVEIEWSFSMDVGKSQAKAL